MNYDIHRPIGNLRLCVVKGRNIRSPELGLPGNVGCRIFWDPTRLMNEKRKTRMLETDESTKASHEVGSTNYVYAMNPAWDEMIESEGTKRLKLLMPTEKGAFFDQSTDSDDSESIDFPILQPIGKSGDIHRLEPWDSPGAAVVIEVQFTDLLNMLPGSEYSVGDVTIPFADIVKNGKISGWYDIKIPGEEDLEIKIPQPELHKKESATEISSSEDRPQLFIKASWLPPKDGSNVSVETVREASLAIQEEMVRSALLSLRESEKLGILGSSLGALNTVRGISANLQVVQNKLGSTLDLIECCVHVFDFTVCSTFKLRGCVKAICFLQFTSSFSVMQDPFKSMVVLGIVFVVWLVLSLISTRVLVLVAGLVSLI